MSTLVLNQIDPLDHDISHSRCNWTRTHHVHRCTFSALSTRCCFVDKFHLVMYTDVMYIRRRRIVTSCKVIKHFRLPCLKLCKHSRMGNISWICKVTKVLSVWWRGIIIRATRLAAFKLPNNYRHFRLCKLNFINEYAHVWNKTPH